MFSLPSLRSDAEHLSAQIPDLKQNAVEAAFHILKGEHARRKSGLGEAFWQFREYQAGDMPRDIDWRQSGKTDRVYIRQSEQHNPQSWMFWCKRHADMDFKSEKALYSKYHAAAILSLCLALTHSRAGEMVSYAGLHEYGHSEKTLRRFENFLTHNKYTPPPMRVPKHAGAMLFSDFLEPVDILEDQFQPLAQKSRNGWLIQTLDPAEIDLPYDGRVLFEDEYGDHKNLIDNVADIRGEYTKRIYAHIEAVARLARRLGWRHVLHRTDTDIRFTAMKIWLEGAR